MSVTGSARCAACDQGELTPTQLTVTPPSDGQSFSVDDDDALLCDACGDELIGERAAAFLLTQRALAPHEEMTATVRRAVVAQAPVLHIACAICAVRSLRQ